MQSRRQIAGIAPEAKEAAREAALADNHKPVTLMHTPEQCSSEGDEVLIE
jgi:hypothetical protein